MTSRRQNTDPVMRQQGFTLLMAMVLLLGLALLGATLSRGSLLSLSLSHRTETATRAFEVASGNAERLADLSPERTVNALDVLNALEAGDTTTLNGYRIMLVRQMVTCASLRESRLLSGRDAVHRRLVDITITGQEDGQMMTLHQGVVFSGRAAENTNSLDLSVQVAEGNVRCGD
ncbi:hypothetical protein [Larsenimonas rhizosphaerae]|uniref:Type 4 fimbrial biogenesis protein PilX N-terminal domain-containing protein n=1 Tax=Larsenimonas rhizosphaerae TaxID=2944682 RepID=A0AA42CYR7_9GAMM|nr:hypothetical protein [Larsenimonas rhizosphaerae]MCM2132215.1 hypothetical protein [Larsenimonas rhizosphaerae]MCX2525470.1 hypothetical protein [Larsenimonas rhizosphaerae]